MSVRSDDGETSAQRRRFASGCLAFGLLALVGGVCGWVWLVGRAVDGPPPPDWVEVAATATLVVGLLFTLGAVGEYRAAARLREAGR